VDLWVPRISSGYIDQDFRESALRHETGTLVDDLDGAEASKTVRFTIGGKSYEIDLSAKNAEQLDKLLEPYRARRAGGRASARPKIRASRAAGDAPTGAAKGKTELTRPSA